MTDQPVRRYINEVRNRATTREAAEADALVRAAGHICERAIRVVESMPISESFAGHISGTEQAWQVAVEVDYDERRRWSTSS
jgi:hypothetical protein